MAEGGETLFFFFGTRAMRAQWFAKEAGIKFNLKWVDLQKGEQKTPEVLKVNPKGAVPALIDGDVYLAESAAILQYLAKKYEKKVNLGLPADASPADAAAYYESIITTATQLDNTIIHAYLHSQILPPQMRNAAIPETNLKTFNDSEVALISKWIKGKDFIAGKHFTVADIMLGYTLSAALKLGWLESHPDIKNYVVKLTSRDGFKHAYDRSSTEYPPAK